MIWEKGVRARPKLAGIQVRSSASMRVATIRKCLGVEGILKHSPFL